MIPALLLIAVGASLLAFAVISAVMLWQSGGELGLGLFASILMIIALVGAFALAIGLAALFFIRVFGRKPRPTDRHE